MNKADILIYGAGAFGLALAVSLDKKGHNITVKTSRLEDILSHRDNYRKLPGVKIPESIRFTDDLDELRDKDMIIFAVPVSAVRETAKKVSPYLTEKSVVLNTAKGLEQETLMRMSEVLGEELPTERIAVLSGPSHAEEVALFMPTTVCVSSKKDGCADYIQSVMNSDFFRVYISDDIIGCELGGALKNIIALCAGICDGVGYGDNTKAALMTRGIAEITRLGAAMGAKETTFSGLTGIGDLIATCTSMHSRNRRAGILIGQGISPDEAVREVGTVEGYFCTKAAYQLAHKEAISMPITEQLYELLFAENNVKQAISRLMSRPKRHESEPLIK